MKTSGQNQERTTNEKGASSRHLYQLTPSAQRNDPLCSLQNASPSQSLPFNNTMPRLLPALTLLFLSRRAFSAALYARQNSTDYVGVSLVNEIPSQFSIGTTGHVRRTKHSPPGEETDPPGVLIYDSLDAIPSAKLLSSAQRVSKCYLKEPQACWKPYVCGHRCEQILLAVDGYCKKGCLRGGCTDVRWRRCKKARKFQRCFTRVCYRRRTGTRTPRPKSYVDGENVSIVRYRRPLPKHEVLARQNKQSSTVSAIFK